MRGIFYFLDYHHWYSIKRLLPYRKQSRGRHAKCWGNPKTVSFGHDRYTEMQGLLDTEIDSYPVRGQDRETNPGSVKANSKTLIHEETSEEDNDKYSSSDSSAELRVQHSCLNHYAKNSAPVRKKCVKFHDGADTIPFRLQNSFLSEQDKLLASNNVEAEQTSTQVMQPVDTLEVFKVKKELFLKVLHNLDYQDRQSSSPKPRLTKSGSFPMPSSEHSRASKPSTLKHKQSEAWSFPKRRNSLSSIQDSEFAGLKSHRNLENSTPSINEDGKELEPRSTSLGKTKGWNQLVINRFKHIKKRIKHVLMESKKERNHTANDALLSRSASSSSEQETTASQDTKDKFESLTESNSSDCMSMKITGTSLKRLSSLNESLDKYTRLLEQDFKKTDSLNQSRSLKLTSENGDLPNKHARKSLRKNLSVADIDLICLSLFEVPHEVLTPSSLAAKTISDRPIDNDHGTQNAESQVIEDVNAQHNEPLASLENPEFKENLQCPASEEVDDNCEGISNAIDLNKEIFDVQLDESKQESDEQVTMLTLNSGCDPAQTSSDPSSGTSFPGNTVSRGDYPVLEAPEAKNQSDQPEPLVDTQETSTTTSRLCIAEEVERNENATTDVVSNLELDKEDADFRYVKNLLALSGFTAEESQGYWDSEDKPMNTSLFKELEIQAYKKPDCFGEDVDVYYHRRIMFELVNEVLAETYDTTYTYFPRPFSLMSCVHPWPMRDHLLDKVWKRVSWYLSLRPELDMTLDDVVCRDLSRNDGWMNVKLENERLALQLEDLIFDELLEEEVIFSGKC